MESNATQPEQKEKKESTAKRDFYVSQVELPAQKKWDELKVFEEDAPENVESTPDNKYMGTFPYPYMNGTLHAGHTFTLTKLEYSVNYQRLKGKHALLPFGFHCTGMPIKACADKLKREIETYGNPPKFPSRDLVEEIKPVELPKEEAKKEDPLAFHAQKSKAKSKAGGGLFQWEIMQSMGIPEDEIAKFADAHYWLSYFPPLCRTDLTRLGVGIDWRRSFITTDVNPYYDSFVRWQFTNLKEKGKVLFGKRYSVFSPKDGQPCADHDRSSGEGVLPQEYTLIKVEVLPPFPEKLKALEGKKVYLVPGTLRPETMYGQTNIWVLPDGDYGAFEINDTDVFISTERAARNMAFQGLSKTPGTVSCLAKIKGWDILGIPVKAPLAPFDKVYTLPMLTISPKKGTGIVTSVPSDSPDDYINLEELRRKPAWREKFNLKDEMVLPYEVVEIIDVPDYGTKAAQKACDELKIKSPKDRELLDEAKERVYQKGFYEGKMIVGEQSGKLVRDAKPLIKEILVAQGQAVVYAEPASEVISRSGDECVVALTDQWYIDYGEPKWRAEVDKHLAGMEFYSPITKNKFEIALGWLNQWACSRTYGLGTRLPWDPTYLIESLSDSTIYMAYYTVAYLLQGGVIDGSKQGPAQIKPELLTTEVWNYILLNAKYPEGCGIPEETLSKLRREFNFWYPVDIRVSGKDLITNHLTFALYNHVAFWPEQKNKLPRSMRANGHVLLDGDKMSKSTGNFLTLKDGIEQYSADGMRFALADAGDSLEDANFETKTATAALLRLYVQVKWVDEILAAKDMRSGPATSFLDRAFSAQIERAIVETAGHYERTNFREALRTGFYELQGARDAYRTNVGSDGMNRDLIMRFIEVQAVLMAPIIPHFSEYIWTRLGKTNTVRKAPWPVAGNLDHTTLDQMGFLEAMLHSFRLRKDAYLNPKKKVATKPAAPTKICIVVAKSYPVWMQSVLKVVIPIVDLEKAWPDDMIMAAVKSNDDTKKALKNVMPFVAALKEEYATKGKAALNLELPFDEKTLFEGEADLIKRSLEVEEVEVSYDESASKCQPGKPFVSFA